MAVSKSSQAASIHLGPLGRIVIGAGGTALYFTCVYSAYGPASAGDMAATFVMLLSGWVFAVGAFTLSEFLSSLSNRHRFLASFSFAIVIAVITGIWGGAIFRAPPTLQKTGARIFFRVEGFAKGDKKIRVNATNNGDVMARIGSFTGSYYALVDHVLTENEEEQDYRIALKALPPMGKGLEFPINVGHSTDIEINLTDAQYDGIMMGTLHFYLFAVVEFKDEVTSPGKTNLASVCGHFNKATDGALVCIDHMESRQPR